MKSFPVAICLVLLSAVAAKSRAQRLKESSVPLNVKTALKKNYPEARKVTWEKENGNFEANWGGRSGEDTSVQYSPAAVFVEIVEAIPASSLPAGIGQYVRDRYKGASITEAGRVTDAAGRTSFEVEVNRRDLLFDDAGKFLKEEKE